MGVSYMVVIFNKPDDHGFTLLPNLLCLLCPKRFVRGTRSDRFLEEGIAQMPS